MNREPLDEPQGLGDRLDDLLLRMEHRAEGRPLLVGTAVVLVVAGLAWLALQPTGEDPPIEDLIPRAEVASTTGSIADVEPAAGGASVAPGDPTGPAPGTAGIAPGGAGSGDVSAEVAGGTGAEPVEVVVHVIGAVARPGLVTVGSDARISDVVEVAGGPATGADLERLNLAAPVVDGMQVRVPVVGELDEGSSAAERPLIRLPGPDGAGAGGGDAGADGRSDSPIDLNRAGQADLQALPGIGPALATAIVDWRTENGPFTTVDDLELVPGIGPAKLAGLRDRAMV